MTHAKLLLVDAYALAYRAYYAIANLRNSKGEPTGALYGFIQTLRKHLTEHQPSHLAVAFDLGEPERLKEFPNYKTQRPPMPGDLEKQIPRIRDWLAACRIAVLQRERCEADDIIATVVTQASHKDWRCLIATNDKDLAQLVNPNVQILLPTPKGKPGSVAILDRDAVLHRYGVEPSQIVDYFSLIGDSSDNIPGVPGIGPKTAHALIQQFGSLQTLLQNLHKISDTKLREKISSHTQLLHRNRNLIALRTDLPLDICLDSLKIASPDYERLIPLLEALEFKSLLTAAETEAMGRAPAGNFQENLL